MEDEDIDDCYEVISWIEEQFRNGDFNIVDIWLANVGITMLSDTAIIGALSMTFWGKEKLFKRNDFLARAEPHLIKNLGKERAEKLLSNRR